MEEIKGKCRPFMISRQNEDQNASPAQIKKGSDESVEDLPFYIILVEEISAVNKQIRLDIQGMSHHGLEVVMDGCGPSETSFGMGVGDPGGVKSEVGVCGVNELYGHELVCRNKNNLA